MAATSVSLLNRLLLPPEHVDKLLTFNLEIDMDNIDLFVDHFVIHSESREALIVNGSKEQFESRLRELVQEEVKEILMLKVRELEQQRDQLPSAKLERHDRLTDGINTLKELHEDLDFWGEEYKEYQDLLR
jgi:hypothetical protein